MELSINKTALLHGVPPTTLKDRLSGRVVLGTNSGPKRYLDEQEELALADHLVESASWGRLWKMRQQVKSLMEKVAVEKNLLRARRISDGWWKKF